MARRSERGPWSCAVRIKQVRAVSTGERMMEDSTEEMPDTINSVAGEDAVRISRSGSGESASSGSPKMADRRLRMNVFSVGRSKEYIKVDVDAFQREVAPFVVQSWPRMSKMAEGSLILSIYFGRDVCGM